MFTLLASAVWTFSDCCEIIFLLILEFPHTTHGKQSGSVGAFSGMLEYSGIMPSFPNGDIYWLGNSVTGTLACSIVGMALCARVCYPILICGVCCLLRC
jgi:hypothetical protein